MRRKARGRCVVEALESRQFLSASSPVADPAVSATDVTTQPAVTNPGGAPNGPFGLSATAASPTVVNLAFYDSATNETGFVIQRATSANGTYTTVATPNAATGSFTTVLYSDTTASPGTTYYYRVYAVNGPYSSSTSSASVTTPAGVGGGNVTAPAAPSGLAAALSGSQVSVSFTDNSMTEADFVLQRSTSAAGTYSTIATITGDAATGTKTYTDSAVAAGTTYYYKVYAENSAGPSASAGPTSGVTTPASVGTTNPGGPPNGPFGLSATATSATVVNLAFYDSATNETGFVVQRATSASGPYTVLATLPSAAGTSSTVTYSDTTAVGSTTYYYQAYAINGPYASSVTSANVTTPAGSGGTTVVAPSAPGNISAVVSGSQVVVTFTDTSTNEVDFVIQRSTKKKGTFTTVGTVSGDSATGTKTFTDGSVAADTTYYYEVYAENAAGVSTSTGPSTAVTTPASSGTTNPGGAPNGPFGLSAAAASATVVNLAFYDSASNETGFVVQRATSQNGTYTTLATLPAAAGVSSTVTYADTTVAGSTTYYYKAYAINGPYASSSATGSVTTPAGGGGSTGTSGITVGANVDATKAAGNEMESQVAINPTNANNLVMVAQNDVNDGNLINVSRSTDGGKTWSTFTLGGAQDGYAVNTQRPDARVIFDAFGNLYIIYMVAGADGIHLVGFRSADGGSTFTFTGSIVGGSDGVSPDDPALATGVYAGNSAIQGVWIVFDDDNTDAVRLVGGTSTGLGQFGGWSTVHTVSDSPGAYASVAVGPNGELAVAWQSSITGQGANNILLDVDAGGTGAGFGVDKIVGATNVGGYQYIPAQPDRSVDAEVKLAFDASSDATRGRLYLAYTDDTTGVANDTDILLRSSDNLGASWANAVRVNNDSGNNSQFLPDLAVDLTTGNVALTWYDARNSADNTTTQLYAAVSTDHGATFSNMQVAAGTSDQAWANPSLNDLDYGDNGAIAFYGGSLVCAWSDNSNSTGNNPNGTDSKFDILTDVLSVTA